MPESDKPFQYDVTIPTDSEMKTLIAENPELHQQVMEDLKAQQLAFEQELREIKLDEAD